MSAAKTTYHRIDSVITSSIASNAGVTVDSVLFQGGNVGNASTLTIVGSATAPADPADGTATLYYDTSVQELRAKLTSTTTVSRLLTSFTSAVYVATYTSATSINFAGLATEVALTGLNVTLPVGTFMCMYQFTLQNTGTTTAYVKAGGSANTTGGTRVEASIVVDSDGTRKTVAKPFIVTPLASTVYQVVFMAGTNVFTAAVVNNISGNVANPDNCPVLIALKLD